MVHSETTVLMDEQCMWPPILLLVISPAHGRVQYIWEKRSKETDEWEKSDVPTHTCLLYVDTAKQYRCTFDGTSIVFNVQG